MYKKKIMLVFGTRPEAVKMAPLVLELKKYPKFFDVFVCVTAQHREMLDQVLQVFEIEPDLDLNLMKKGQGLVDVTTLAMTGIQEALELYRPDILVVHGDTTTTLAAAMAGFYAGVQVGHVEAGLRTGNMQAPFPEEFNRQVTSKITRWHFAPTEKSRQNLISEGIHDQNIIVTGNTVVDALHWTLVRTRSDAYRAAQLDELISQALSFDWKKGGFVLVTGHRRENFGAGINQICEALLELARDFSSIDFVFPVHLNPNIQDPVGKRLTNVHNIHLTKPLDYEPFVYLMQHCLFILTDSGGIQEEAPSLNKPVLVTREATERPEAVASGAVQLVGTSKENIVSGVARLINEKEHYAKMSLAQNPYGDGKACERIVRALQVAKLKAGDV